MMLLVHTIEAHIVSLVVAVMIAWMMARCAPHER